MTPRYGRTCDACGDAIHGPKGVRVCPDCAGRETDAERARVRR